VLAENLHAERHLETTYYATDLKQMTDFAWYRGSGVRVNVAARDVNLVPAYDDVTDAGSDNDFVLTNPGATSADVTRFQEVIRRYCRSVVYAALDWQTSLELIIWCFSNVTRRHVDRPRTSHHGNDFILPADDDSSTYKICWVGPNQRSTGHDQRSTSDL